MLYDRVERKPGILILLYSESRHRNHVCQVILLSLEPVRTAL